MGWGRMLLFGDVGQQMDLSEAREELEKLSVRIGTERALREGADEMIGRLRRENAELKLHLAAVTRVLVSKKLATPEDLRQVVEALRREGTNTDGGFGPLIPDA